MRQSLRLWALVLVFVLACATENVIEVVVTSVSVLPANADMVAGGAMTFDAVVSDEGGAVLEGATVLWSSDAPDVVSVDGAGVASARSEGVATIAAEFQGVKGSATLTVFPPPSIVLAPLEVAIVGGTSGPRPQAASVRVENGSIGQLHGLEAEARYEAGQPTDWLDIELAASVTPTTLALTARIDGLPAGVHDGTVIVRSGESGVADMTLPVRLSLAGFKLTEVGGSTRVRERGASETLTVVLELQPERDIELTVTSMAPSEVIVSPSRLTFKRSNWSTPKTVVVTAVNDAVVNGDRTALVRVSVDADAGSGYATLDHQDVVVHVLDDDVAGLRVTETRNDTWAWEGEQADTIKVVLTAGPLSDVVVRVTSDDERDATVSPGALTFTPLTWNVPQAVAFIAVEDGVSDGTQGRLVTFSVDNAASAQAFHGLKETISATTLDPWWRAH